MKTTWATLTICALFIASIVLPSTGLLTPVPLAYAQPSTSFKRLAPVLSTSIAGLISKDDPDPPNPEQLSRSSANLIAYAKGSALIVFDPIGQRTLWKQPRPTLFTVWDDLLIVSDANGLVTAYRGRDRERVWSVQALNQSGSRYAPRILQAVGDILVMTGRATVDDLYTYTTSGLDPRNGANLWRNEAWLARRHFTVSQNRFLVFPPDFQSPPMVEPSASILDSTTGQFSASAHVLNRSWDANEYVILDFPKRPGFTDHPVRDSYTVRVSLQSARGSSLQTLGTYDFTPPINCLERLLILPAVGGRNYTQIGPAVLFLSANKDYVWLEVYNDCNRRVVRIPRSSPTQPVTLELPEAMTAQQRAELYKERKITSPSPTGRFTAQQRTDWLGETVGLARLRAKSDNGDLLWSAQISSRIYAFYRSKELRAFDTSGTTLLGRALIALPDAALRGVQALGGGVNLMQGRVFSWQYNVTAIASHFYYFVVPF